MKYFIRFAAFFVLSASLLVSGCTPQPAGKFFVKDGKQYGIVKSGTFRHRWWNYFERGLSYAEGKYYSYAIDDFQEAIRQREKGFAAICPRVCRSILSNLVRFGKTVSESDDAT